MLFDLGGWENLFRRQSKDFTFSSALRPYKILYNLIIKCPLPLFLYELQKYLLVLKSQNKFTILDVVDTSYELREIEASVILNATNETP